MTSKLFSLSHAFRVPGMIESSIVCLVERNQATYPVHSLVAVVGVFLMAPDDSIVLRSEWAGLAVYLSACASTPVAWDFLCVLRSLYSKEASVLCFVSRSWPLCLIRVSEQRQDRESRRYGCWSFRDQVPFCLYLLLLIVT